MWLGWRECAPWCLHRIAIVIRGTHGGRWWSIELLVVVLWLLNLWVIHRGLCSTQNIAQSIIKPMLYNCSPLLVTNPDIINEKLHVLINWLIGGRKKKDAYLVVPIIRGVGRVAAKRVKSNLITKQIWKENTLMLWCICFFEKKWLKMEDSYCCGLALNLIYVGFFFSVIN